jgi:hypothetical protein
MNEAILHELSQQLGGRFKLTALVQKRLVQLMQSRHPIISQQSGGRPIRSVVNEVAVGKLQLVNRDDETPVTPELEEPLLDSEPEIEYNAPPRTAPVRDREEASRFAAQAAEAEGEIEDEGQDEDVEPGDNEEEEGESEEEEPEAKDDGEDDESEGDDEEAE